MTDNHRNQGVRRPRGNIAEDMDMEKRDRDNREGGTGEHGLNVGTGGLKGRQEGEIKTGGGEVEVSGGEVLKRERCRSWD